MLNVLEKFLFERFSDMQLKGSDKSWPAIQQSLPPDRRPVYRP
jgi:hypothetical protein